MNGGASSTRNKGRGGAGEGLKGLPLNRLQTTHLWITALTRLLPLINQYLARTSLSVHYAVPSGGHFARWVLSGRAACWGVLGVWRRTRCWHFQPANTSPHLVVVLKETKLYLPCKNFGPTSRVDWESIIYFHSASKRTSTVSSGVSDLPLKILTNLSS